jgi:hypothetical protein
MRDALGDPAPVIVSVRPLRSFAEAEYLAHEVPDTTIPDATLDLLERAGDGAADAGVELAADLVRGIRSLVDGVVLALPDGPAAAGVLLSAARGE